MTFKNLGCLNAWPTTPPLVQKCRELGHSVDKKTPTGRTYNNYECKLCGYTFSVDSSG